MRCDNDGRSSSHQQLQYLSPSSLLSEQLPLPKFKTAYNDIEDRRKSRILTFDIEKIDSCISLSTTDRLCIVGSSSGKRKYTNAPLMRLCVRALISKRQQGGFEESTNVIFIDAGGRSSGVYQCVNFTRQYILYRK
jgi:hypothetical protein